MSYALPKKTADASWVGSEAYARPGSPVDGRWGDGDRGAGIRRLAPKGWLSQRVQAAKLYEGGQYVPPFGGVHAAWAGSGIYTPPERGVRAFWARVVGDDQYLPGVGMGDAGAVGTPAAVYTQIATAAGTAPPGLGTPTTEQIYRLSAAWVGAPPYTPPGMMAYGWWAGIPDGSVFPAGRRQSACGVARILNAAEELRVEGIPGRVFFGAAEAWNYHTYVSLQARGISSQLFGAAYMQGGVKYVAPGAVTAPVPPAPVVVNTKADQTAAPAGVAWPGMGAVNVSPRLLRPHGIYGTAAGSPRVQFPPQPGGWLSSASGYPVVEFRTRVVQPAGVYSFGEGFPRAADRARKVFHGASPVSAVFGDVRVRAKNFRVQVSGLPPLEIAPWTEARNTRRYLGALGALSQAFGAEATAHNKTPSIAPAGLDTQQFGRADHTVVGWRVRSVVAPGAPVPFPQFGAVSLWQPPSLAPAGIAAKAVPAPTVGPAIRRVLVDGRDMQRFEGATVWFSYRFVVAKDQGIAGASYGTARAEHGRRGIAILGAPFMAFGTTWVSRGLRVLGPQGISAPLLSRHQVGGTRFLGPEGFYATRWLARITPEDREVFPKTFGAEYGLAKVGNKQRPVYPAGIRTYSEEAQRWGTARLWGLRQIVTMYEDQESGLWPMPWPQWTAVENRNKVMQAAGFNAERFPGALVENGARLVVPAGVAYPTLPEYQKTGAVTHCVRPLLLDGVDAPMLSRWAVSTTPPA